MSVEQKQEFIDALKEFVTHGGKTTPSGYRNDSAYSPHRGELLLMAGVADFFRMSPQIVDSELGVNWCHYLPEWLDEAFVALRTESAWKPLREQYRNLTDGNDVPSLVNAHEGGLHRSLVVGQIVRLLPILAFGVDGRSRSWLEKHLSEYVFAQDRAIEQAWHRFIRGPYRKLMPRIRKESHRGNKGTFGKTKLLSYAMAGRVMFTFSRGNDSMTFVADDGDMYGHRAGMNAPTSPFLKVIEMVHDVVEHWDIDKFQEDDHVRLAGL